MLKQHEIQNIQYTKIDKAFEATITERVIIPTFVPQPNVKAVDVTDFSEDEQVEMKLWMEEYAQYVEDYKKTMFKFEDWVACAKNIEIEPKWRTFKIVNTKLL